MIKISFKYFKIIFLSFCSFLVYYILTKSVKFNSFLTELVDKESSYAFGYYILIKIGMWFLIVFGIISLLVVLVNLSKTYNN